MHVPSLLPKEKRRKERRRTYPHLPHPKIPRLHFYPATYSLPGYQLCLLPRGVGTGCLGRRRYTSRREVARPCHGGEGETAIVGQLPESRVRYRVDQDPANVIYCSYESADGSRGPDARVGVFGFPIASPRLRAIRQRGAAPRRRRAPVELYPRKPERRSYKFLRSLCDPLQRF